MCPQQRPGCARGSSKKEKPGRHVESVPNLLRNQAHTFSEIFQSAQIRFRVMTSGDLIMPALGRQQRPGTTCAPTAISTAVITLPVIIVVVAYLKSERRLGNAVYFTGEVPPCIVEESFAIGEEKLQIANLRVSIVG